ncbi:hypothetical protein [Amycolatopsis rifamycinica]|uniref:hypothetical protein n=1 Tax=Amycolatopsis rifamycinica TaxID=287986 RepID=UPI00126A5092|nr:hypothetical protein [Amycolatopsis rifamycinica]
MVTEGPLTAAQIYEQVTGGAGIDSLANAQDGAIDLTDRMADRALRIAALRAKTTSGWRGNAGEAAADATRPLVDAAADDAVHLQYAQAAVGAQMDAFGTAKNSVKPVAPQPPELDKNDVLNVITGKGWDSYTTKVAGWQADSQANIDAFSAYHSASTTNGGQMPAQYAQLADSGAPVSMTDRSAGDKAGDKAGSTDTGTTDTGEWARNPRQTQVPAQQDRRTVQSSQDQVAGQNQQNFQNLQSQQPGSPDGTHANSYIPKPVLPAAQGGYEFGPTGQAVNNLGTNWPGGFGPGTGPYVGGGYQTGPGTPGTGPGTRTGTPSTGTPGTPGGSTGTGTPGTRTPGGSTGTPGTPGSRPNQPGFRSPGGSTGARLPEERLPGTNRSAGPRGANGLPVGGTPLAGRGGKEEDREKKKAPYLQNPDPDETFGGFTEKPMPPVIGETKKR